MGLKKLLIKTYTKLCSLYDNKTAKLCDVSIGDIYLQRCDVEQNQFLASSRYLDIQRYCTSDDRSFYYQNAISRKTYGAKHREEDGNTAFTRLIESYKCNGYMSNSPLTVDKNIRLMDGNHRVAANLFFDISEIKVRVLKRKSKVPKNIDWYYNALLSTATISDVMDEYEIIQQKLVSTGNTFCCLLDSIKEKTAKDILNDLKYLVTVLHVTFRNSNQSHSGGGTAYLVQFSVKDPRYQYKDGKMVSLRCVEIEAIISKRYPDIDMNISKNCLDGKKLFDEFNGGIQ